MGTRLDIPGHTPVICDDERQAAEFLHYLAEVMGKQPGEIKMTRVDTAPREARDLAWEILIALSTSDSVSGLTGPQLADRLNLGGGQALGPIRRSLAKRLRDLPRPIDPDQVVTIVDPEDSSEPPRWHPGPSISDALAALAPAEDPE